MKSWFLYAISSAVFWGLDYAIFGKLLEKIHPTTVLFLQAIFSITFFLIFNKGTIISDANIITRDKMIPMIFLSLAVGFCANLFTSYAIYEKNASIAGFLEISYPLFIVLFSWILFRNIDVTWKTLMGGILILIGILIIYKNE